MSKDKNKEKKNKKKSEVKKADPEDIPSADNPGEKKKNPFSNPANFKNFNKNPHKGNIRPNPAAMNKTQHKGG